MTTFKHLVMVSLLSTFTLASTQINLDRTNGVYLTGHNSVSLNVRFSFGNVASTLPINSDTNSSCVIKDYDGVQ